MLEQIRDPPPSNFCTSAIGLARIADADNNSEQSPSA
jgi:hypothetical protein